MQQMENKVFLKFFLIFTISLISLNLTAEIKNESIDNVMHGLGIKYLVSEDRKLPKKDREKWESDLSEYVNFKSLNSGMRERILTAIKTSSEEDIDEESASYLQDKAVLFLVPRELSDYTLSYLKFRDKHGAIKLCSNENISNHDLPIYFCQKEVSSKETHINIYGKDSSEVHVSLVFEYQGRWVLSNIISPISERTLMLIGRWK